jgi:hypothetical protein
MGGLEGSQHNFRTSSQAIDGSRLLSGRASAPRWFESNLVLQFATRILQPFSMRLYPNRQRECVESACSVRSSRARRTNPDHAPSRPTPQAGEGRRRRRRTTPRRRRPGSAKVRDASGEASPLSMERDGFDSRADRQFISAGPNTSSYPPRRRGRVGRDEPGSTRSKPCSGEALGAAGSVKARQRSSILRSPTISFPDRPTAGRPAVNRSIVVRVHVGEPKAKPTPSLPSPACGGG